MEITWKELLDQKEESRFELLQQIYKEEMELVKFRNLLLKAQAKRELMRVKAKEFKGNYNAEIDVEKFRAIIDLLNYIDVKKLKDNEGKVLDIIPFSTQFTLNTVCGE